MFIADNKWEKFAEYDDDYNLIGLKSDADSEAVDSCVSELCGEYDWKDEGSDNYKFLLDGTIRSDLFQGLKDKQLQLFNFINLLKRIGAKSGVIDKYTKRYAERQKNISRYEMKCC